jgi:hypothetical protein
LSRDNLIMDGSGVRYTYEPGRVLYEREAGRIVPTEDELKHAPRGIDRPSLAQMMGLENK